MKKLDLKLLKSLLDLDEIDLFKKKLKDVSKKTGSKDDEIKIVSNGKETFISTSFFLGEIDQILQTRTLQRSKYYLTRLIKGLTEVKTSKINDINLNRWKEYDDIITDSLWIIDKRDKSGAHKAEYWGNFIPQIPNQFLRRYTKKSEWILDPFLGSGTTLIECKRLGRNGIGIELNKDVAGLAKKLIGKEKNPKKIVTKIITGDSSSINIKNILEKEGIQKVQFVIMHPPYWDIIKFSKSKKDLSNADSVEKFLKMFGKVIDNTAEYLEKGRYLAVVIGDKYSNGEWIPLGFYTMQEVMKRGYKLKSTIVKNFDTTKGKMNQKELWRYRALAGGFYIFKHEYIFLFQR
ncbi:modification methylase DpnIIB [bacterium BMS3Abin03]|nr:modification methylase DpnIIB [bacterium BMS3Abin03]